MKYNKVKHIVTKTLLAYLLLSGIPALAENNDIVVDGNKKCLNLQPIIDKLRDKNSIDYTSLVDIDGDVHNTNFQFTNILHEQNNFFIEWIKQKELLNKVIQDGCDSISFFNNDKAGAIIGAPKNQKLPIIKALSDEHRVTISLFGNSTLSIEKIADNKLKLVTIISANDRMDVDLNTCPSMNDFFNRSHSIITQEVSILDKNNKDTNLNIQVPVKLLNQLQAVNDFKQKAFQCASANANRTSKKKYKPVDYGGSMNGDKDDDENNVMPQ